MTTVTNLEIRLLGHFGVWRNGQLLEKEVWPQPKVQALLKILLVERGQVYTHDQLIEATFPDLEPQKATLNLQKRVSELRAVLQPHLKKRTESQFILRVGQGYCFNKEADCWIDTEAFEQLASTAITAEGNENWAEAIEIYKQALQLYQGDFLSENLYEEWSLQPRERWRNELLHVLLGVAECHARSGEYENAVEYCEQAISLNNFREASYRSLMIYAWRLGELSKVSQVFQECSSILEELNVRPSQETQELLEQIQNGDVSALEPLYPSITTRVQTGRASILPAVKSIAVLPFVNMDAEQEPYDYFSDGITEDSLTQLSKLGNIKVISRTSSMQYKNSDKSLIQIGKELGVTTILEGSVRRQKDQVRVVVQLINVKTDDHIWAETFDYESDSVFEIQSDVAQQIAKALKVWVSPLEQQNINKFSTISAEAYSLLLLGRYHWDKFTKEGFELSIKYFLEAIKLDPQFALAYVRLAHGYSQLAGFGGISAKKGKFEAKLAIEKALEIDPKLPEAIAARALLKMGGWDWLGAESDFRTAISLNPNALTPHNLYGNLLTFMGHFDEAIEEKEISYSLDPVHLRTKYDLGRAYFYAGQDEKAIRVYKSLIEMNPNFFNTQIMLGMIYIHQEKYEEAHCAIEKQQPLSGTWGVLIEVSKAFFKFKTGDNVELKKLINILVVESEKQHIPPAIFAFIYPFLGKKDQGLIWLKKSIEQRDQMLWDFKVHPLLKEVWSDPDYEELLCQVGYSGRIDEA